MEYIDIEKVKTEGNFLKAICFKPKTAPFICAVAGILMLIVNNLYVRILGLFFIAMSFLVLRFVKDFKVIDIFDKGVMIYEDDELKKACFINYDDISIWSVKHNEGHDTIEFTLNDGTLIIKNSFEADKAYRVLNNLIREKEERYLQKLKDRENELYVPDAIRNIVRKFKNRK